MFRIGCKDRWKLRCAPIPRLRLGNNGKPWSTKISPLIFVPHGFPFFRAIQPRQLLKYLRNLRPKLFRLLRAFKSTRSCSSCLTQLSEPSACPAIALATAGAFVIQIILWAFRKVRMASAVSSGRSMGTKWLVFSKRSNVAAGTWVLKRLTAGVKNVSDSAP